MTKLIPPLMFWFIGLFLMWDLQPVSRRKNRPKIPARPSLRISVIIPARNEEHPIQKLLRSLKDQTIEPYEVIVVDDESNDNTAVMAQKLSAKVVKGKKTEVGWLGKSWACWQGSQHASGDTFLFLDADTWLAPNGLQDIALAYLERGGLVTVQPYHETVKLYEQLSAFFNIIAMAGLNAFTPLGNKLHPSGGFGPCVICSREDYFAAGGHAAVKERVLEDIALAQTFSSKGYPVSCYSGKGSIAFRMYPAGLRSLLEGWSKGFAEGSVSIRRSFLLLTILWITGCFEASIAPVASFFAPDMRIFWAMAALYGLYVLQIGWMLTRIGKFHMGTALLFPIPLIFFTFLMLWSAVQKHLLKKTVWKDRVIRFDRPS